MKLGSYLGLKVAGLSIVVGLSLSACTTTQEASTTEATEEGMPAEMETSAEGDAMMPAGEAPSKVKAKGKKKKKMKKKRMKKKRKAAPAPAGE